jgi:hypothetical protein
MQDFHYDKPIKKACHLRRRALPCSSCGKSAASLRATSGYMVCASLGSCRFAMGSITLRHLMLPNSSFKPTPHRGVNSVLYATLHAAATPLRGGLTQALGGEKRSLVVLLAAAALWLRSAWLPGHVLGALPLRLTSSGALKHHLRCAPRLRNRCPADGQHVRSRRGRFCNDRRTVRLARPGIRASVFRPVRNRFTFAGFLRA